MTLPSLPWNNLSEYIKDYTKGLQILVDSVSSEPDADNSNFAIEPLYEFDCCIWYKGKVRFVTDQFNDGQHGNGYQGLVYTSRLTLQNNVLHVLPSTYMGKGQPAMDWNGYSAADYNVVKDVAENIVMGIRNNYSSNDIIVHANQYGNVYFQPSLHNKSDIGLKYTEMGTEKSSSELNIQFQNITLGWENDYVTNSTSLGDLGTGAITLNIPVKTPVLAVVKNDNEAANLVSVLSPYNTHNSVLNTSSQGNYKIYYGDNYIIYSIPSGTLIKYNDIFNATKTVANTINVWTPTSQPIVVPTYKDNKYDEIDANHTKPMELNKFVPDTNGMVYYYELDKDDVWKVRAGLNTINLDPLVLKDVTRNLISYKIFAFDPITLIKTKTPVIVHIGGREIKYNDKSIPANYVEELNKIQLGSITINKLFGDYRDYAPYTKIELFVPFCGWTTLPSWCIDTTITGEMFVDMWNGSCKAVIKANSLDAPDGVVVCEMGGVCAYDVPFVADATGAKAASLLSKVATTAGAVATGNPLAIATSGISLATALNENYTRMIGVVGDGSNINGLDHMFVKLTRVSWTDPHRKTRPETYKHMHGIPCGKELELTAGDGFTQIMDANITGAMTDREKQMISDGFKHGLIL